MNLTLNTLATNAISLLAPETGFQTEDMPGLDLPTPVVAEAEAVVVYPHCSITDLAKSAQPLQRRFQFPVSFPFLTTSPARRTSTSLPTTALAASALMLTGCDDPIDWVFSAFGMLGGAFFLYILGAITRALVNDVLSRCYKSGLFQKRLLTKALTNPSHEGFESRTMLCRVVERQGIVEEKLLEILTEKNLEIEEGRVLANMLFSLVKPVTRELLDRLYFLLTNSSDDKVKKLCLELFERTLFSNDGVSVFLDFFSNCQKVERVLQKCDCLTASHIETLFTLSAGCTEALSQTGTTDTSSLIQRMLDANIPGLSGFVEKGESLTRTQIEKIISELEKASDQKDSIANTILINDRLLTVAIQLRKTPKLFDALLFQRFVKLGQTKVYFDLLYGSGSQRLVGMQDLFQSVMAQKHGMLTEQTIDLILELFSHECNQEVILEILEQIAIMPQSRFIQRHADKLYAISQNQKKSISGSIKALMLAICVRFYNARKPSTGEQAGPAADRQIQVFFISPTTETITEVLATLTDLSEFELSTLVPRISEVVRIHRVPVTEKQVKILECLHEQRPDLFALCPDLHMLLAQFKRALDKT